MKRPILQLAAICSLAFTLNLSAAVHYVNLNCTNPVSPYISLSTAATNIQDAIDAAVDGDQILVTNGVYQAGGRLASGQTTNRVAVTKVLTVQSMNGPVATVIKGYQVPGTTNGPGAVRCVYLTNNAVLSGFTLTSGATTYTDGNGGGIRCRSTSAIVSNCVLTGNAASTGGGAYQGTFYNCTISSNCLASNGGGTAYATLYNCVVAGNSSTYVGGGVEGGTLYNCLVVNNSASSSGGGAYYADTLENCTIVGNRCGSEGGGSYEGALTNCIVYYNVGYAETANIFNSTMVHHCCTTPTNYMAADNFTNAPLFVDIAHGNLHLQSNSPCINAGDNSCVIGSTDLDCRPRIVGGKVDVGVYEFQGAEVAGYINWLQQYTLPTDSSSDFSDFDHDGLNNWQEWKTGTNPTNLSSVLKMASPRATNNPPRLIVTWQSVSGILYFLQSGTNLGAQPAFSTIQDGIAGQAGTTSYTDTNAVGAGPFFYRVGVQ